MQRRTESKLDRRHHWSIDTAVRAARKYSDESGRTVYVCLVPSKVGALRYQLRLTAPENGRLELQTIVPRNATANAAERLYQSGSYTEHERQLYPLGWTPGMSRLAASDLRPTDLAQWTDADREQYRAERERFISSRRAAEAEPESCTAAEYFRCANCVNDRYCSQSLQDSHTAAQQAAERERDRRDNAVYPDALTDWFDAAEAVSETEEPPARSCPACGAVNYSLGTLGRLEHFSCRSCGLLYSDRTEPSGNEAEPERPQLGEVPCNDACDCYRDALAELESCRSRVAELERHAPLVPPLDGVRCEDCGALCVPNLSADDDGSGSYGWSCVDSSCRSGREQLGETEPEDWQAIGLPQSLARALCVSLDALAERLEREGLNS